MPISHSDALFQLVWSMTKAEKKHFRLYTSRNISANSSKFIKLFNIIEKQKNCDDTMVLKKLDGVSKSQYSNLKRHLYSQILTSMRLVQQSKRVNLRVRELFDFSQILYGKGLYLQALKILQIAKREASKHHLNFMHLTIVEQEKIIETRHITRSGEKKAEELVRESRELTNRIDHVVYLSNLRTELHGLYLKYGHNRDSISQKELQTFFNTKIDHIDESALGVLEMIYLQQSYVWYHHIQLDFENCHEHARIWVNLFLDHPELIHRDVDLFMRGYHYVLSSCFHLKNATALKDSLSELEDFRKSNYKKLNKNSQIISFLYVHTGRLNVAILTGDFNKGLEYIPRTLRRINRYRDKLDNHRILVFYYKIAWIYFGAGKPRRAIEYLNKIVNQVMPDLREDLQIYARLLFLLCHYELKNFDSLPYLIKSFKPFFKKVREQYPLQLITYDMFKELTSSPLAEHNSIMSKYLRTLKELKKDKFRTVSFTYLDVTLWLTAKLEKSTIEQVLSEKNR